MILFILANILCYLLICYLVLRFYFLLALFLFQSKVCGRNNISMEIKSDCVKDENRSSKDPASLEDLDDDEYDEIENVYIRSARDSVPSLTGESCPSIVKKYFDLISAVDYLNLDNDNLDGNECDGVGKHLDKKSCGSMFEELLKCLEGKTRTDFYCWEDVLSGREDSLKILLSRNFNIDGTDREGDSLLHYACRTKDKHIVTDLIEKGARITVNKKMESPLHISASVGDIEISKILLDSQAAINSPDNFGYTPLHLAVKSMNVELVEELLNRGADVSARTHCNLQPVHLSINNTEILKLLVHRKVDINGVSNDGSSALHFASRSNCYESLDLLLKNRALINMRDSNGSSPLLILCKNFSFYSEDNVKCFRCVKLLLERGACVNITDRHCSTPLHFAAENELIDIMELLLEFGADPNLVSEVGDSPLHIAVRNQSLEVVYTLLEWGACIDVAGSNGETPLDVAAQSLLLLNAWNYSSEVLVKHIAKLSAASIDLPTGNSLSTLYKKISSEFIRRCSEEVYKLSLKPILPSLTHLDILTKYEGYLTKYVRHHQVEELFRLGDYLTEFPLYSSLLTLRFRRGFERDYLIKKSYKYFKNLSTVRLPRLTFDCFEVICRYLKVADLRRLAHGFQCDGIGACPICRGASTIPTHIISQPPGTKRFQLIKILNY